VRGQSLTRKTLPRPAHGCLGRNRELAELERLLAGGERLLTLVGPGGIGKTRLAVELGWRLASESEREASDIAFCDLTRAATSVEIAESVARASGCAFGAQATAAALVELVDAHLSDRSGLVVILDNFEQLTPYGAETVGAWRAASPDTRFLVTSREPLGFASETIVRLASLDQISGVLLFADRVLPEHREAVLATANRPAVEALVDRLDGIPLALELAASRVGVLSVKQLCEQLSHRFRLLASRRRDLPVRQATLRGTLDWSWNLLSESERSALAQLSVFRGCSLDAAEQVLELPGGERAARRSRPSRRACAWPGNPGIGTCWR
jgi:predicted ATPase